ncbi:glycosyl-4,4'-diaponeurosporenoate acyltransferase CrtO family protein [Spirosoma pomorum]
MFWFTVLESQLKPAFTSRYFDSYPFEKCGKVYQALGIEWYRALLIKIGWDKIRQQQTPIKKDVTNFIAYERATRISEAGHLIIAIIVFLVTCYILFTYSILNARWLILSNIFFNIYPILLQRYTRPTIQRIISKFSSVELNSIHN